MNATPGDVAPVAAGQADGIVDLSRDWRRLTIYSAAAVTLVEAALLQRKYGLFTGGAPSTSRLGTWADAAAFLMVALLLNVTVAAPFCGLALLAGRRLRLRSWALTFAGLAAGSIPILAADFLRYQLWAYLGDAFDFRLMFDLTGHRVSEIFAAAAPLVTRPLTLAALLAGATLLLIWALHRLQPAGTPTLTAPSPRMLARGFAGLCGIAALTALLVVLLSESMAYGLHRMPVGDMTLRLLDLATDFDGDGYGLLSNPRDVAPFDSTRHPFALEIPGNGIDENGLAGDLPVDRAVYQEAPPPTALWRAKPPVLLFVLESFRADVVGASYRGRPVTPVLDALTSRGVKVDSAWSHNGFTRQSRFHILTGSMTGRRGTSLLDDFKNNGYQVTYFSAQDDTAFGATEINYDRVDKFYDARQDVARRYSIYTTPGSLAVPYNVLEEHIHEYLASRRSKDPLFMYVNFHDTHYPYNHPGLKNILGGEPLPPSLISPNRRGDLWRTYLNAAANVDAAIGRVVEAVKASVGAAPAVIVISDHGESLLEGGFLGHGYALNPAQTQIPLVVTGLPMKIRTPFGQAGLRDALNDALAALDPQDQEARPQVERGRDTRVFQYLGSLETPGQIGWLMSDGQFTYDFRSNRVGLWDTLVKPDALIAEPQEMFNDLVHTWESMQLALANRPLRD